MTRCELYKQGLEGIRDRFDERDTGEGVPLDGGSLAWAMWTDAIRILREALELTDPSGETDEPRSPPADPAQS